MQRGQVLVVVALSIVGIVAIIGLALDVGMMFIANARLRRAVDAAALAAALQFREGYSISELDLAATEFLTLNGIHDPGALVQICITPAPDPADTYNYSHYDAALCTDPPRKLVRVYATGAADLAFLPVVGINSFNIAAEATSETASVAVVLVIDRSESMTYSAPAYKASDPTAYDPMRDPSVCNDPGNSNFNTVDPHISDGDIYDPSYTGFCRPFDQVKKAAVDFLDSLYFPYDQVAVVTFDQNPHAIDINGNIWSNNLNDIKDAVKALTVFQGDETVDPIGDPTGLASIYPNGNPSRYYLPDGSYLGLGCPNYDLGTYPNNSPAPCTTTNIGAGLDTAGTQFTSDMQSSLWVVILLTDGVANAGYASDGSYFCPEVTWPYADTRDASGSVVSLEPKCNDDLSGTRHNPSTALEYDSEDYAYDAAYFVAHDQNALLFTIGLGSQVETPSTLDGTYLGELFLRYASGQACGLAPCPGTYNFAPDSSHLREIFRKIAENIATRLAH